MDGKDDEPTTTLPAPTTRGPQPYWNIRLPDSIRPNHYDLTLDIDLEASTFSGKVLIDVLVTTPTVWVLLHAKELSVTSSSKFNPWMIALDAPCLMS